MILRPNSLARHSGPPSPTTATPALPIPAWLRRAVPNAQNLAGNEIEDEAALRDAVLLACPGNNVGPAGRMLLA